MTSISNRLLSSWKQSRSSFSCSCQQLRQTWKSLTAGLRVNMLKLDIPLTLPISSLYNTFQKYPAGRFNFFLTFSAFSILKESTVRKFRKKYKKPLKESKAKSPEKALGLRGRPLILVHLDEDVSHKDTSLAYLQWLSLNSD